jgi:hypothetical protein
LAKREDLDDREAWLTGVWQDAEATAKRAAGVTGPRPLLWHFRDKRRNPQKNNRK